VAGRGAVLRAAPGNRQEAVGLDGSDRTKANGLSGRFVKGNQILSRIACPYCRTRTVEARSVDGFQDRRTGIAGMITRLRQLFCSPVVERAAQDLSASVVLPEMRRQQRRSPRIWPSTIPP